MDVRAGFPPPDAVTMKLQPADAHTDEAARTKAFISYAREDVDFVRDLHGALGRAGVEAWVDLEGIPPTGEWLLEIERAIDGAHACVFVLSPAYQASEVCRVELDYAVTQNKRLIPIVHRPVDDAAIPDDLARLNWIFALEDGAIAPAFATVVEAIGTDLDWVRDHAVLLEKAREWQEAERAPSYALHGEELVRYEGWLAKAGPKDLSATPLQTEFILASRRDATRRQRRMLGAVAGALVTLVFLGTFGYFQSRERQRQATIATARQLINQSESVRANSPAQSLTTAVRAMRLLVGAGEISVDADLALRRSLGGQPGAVETHDLDLRQVEATDADPAGRFLAIAHGRREIVVWDAVEQRISARCDDARGAMVRHSGIAVSADGRTLVVLTADGGDGTVTATVWRVPGCVTPGQFEVPDGPGSARVSPDGRIAAVVGFRRLMLLRVDDAGLTRIAPPLDAASVLDLAFTSDGARAAFLTRPVGTRTYEVALLGMDDGRFGAVRGRIHPAGRVEALRAGPAGEMMILGAGPPAFIEPGQIEAGTPRGAPDVDKPATWAISRAPRFLAHEIGSGRIRIDRLETGTRYGPDVGGVVLDHATDVDRVMVPPGPNPTVVTVSGGTIRTWRLSGGRAVAEAQAFGPLERVDLIGDSDPAVAIGESAAILVSFPVDPDAPAAAMSRIAVDSARMLAPVPLKVVLPEGTAFERSSVILARGAAERELDVGEPVLAAAAAPDGSRVAIVSGAITRAGWERRVRLFDAESLEVLADTILSGFASDAVAGAVAYSGDGRYLLIPTPDGFQGWDAGTFALSFEVFPGNAAGLVTQPGGTLAATFGRGDTRVWDTTTGTEVARIEHDGFPAARAAISADGDWLVTTHDDGALRIWAVSPAALLAQACPTHHRTCT